MNAFDAPPSSRLLQGTGKIPRLVHLDLPQPEAKRLLRLLTSDERETRFPATVGALQILHLDN
jgi:hypothetical protein